MMRLTRKKVVEAALELTNEVGLDELTTRRLGERLGVKGPALYRHFASKQELVTAMGVAFFAGQPVIGPGATWEQVMEGNARHIRAKILACRDGARIIAQAKPNMGSDDLDKRLQIYFAAGFTRNEAIYAIHLLGRFVMGWTRAEQEFGGRTPPLDLDLNSEEAFDFALKTLIAGLQVRLIAAGLGQKRTLLTIEDA